jgi:hypothetical protein
VGEFSNKLIDGGAAKLFGDSLFLLFGEHAGEASGEGGNGIGIGSSP